MKKKEIIEKLAKKYIEIDKEYQKADDEWIEDIKEAQIDLLDDIFDEIFNIKDLYVHNGCLMSFGRKIG
jgi:DNA-binding protein H-NS